MTLNILFLSVTIKKRKESLKEAIQNEIIEQLYEQHKDRQAAAYRSM